MLERRSHRAQLALIATMSLAGLWAWRQLPPGALVPIHFDANGTPNGWAEPVWGLFLMPALAATMWGLRALVPRVDPRGYNLERSGAAVDTIWMAIAAFLTVLQGVIVASASGASAPGSSLGLVLVGGLFLVIGNVMGKLRPNYTVGIRTPWTLANDRVWDQTHRFGGKTLVAAGVCLWVLAALPLDPDWHGPAVVVVSLISVALTTLKSYVLWRALQKKAR